MKFAKTKINSMHIESFRNLQDVNIAIGTNITILAGRNGTGKSTILGSIAQICSFDRNYVPDQDRPQCKEYNPKQGYELNYKTYYGTEFSSEFTDHFRISNEYDTPDKQYKINFEIEDAQEELFIKPVLSSTKRGKNLRLVLRKDASIINNTSRNITHPVIFLGLERLLPISKRKLNSTEPKLSLEEKTFLAQCTTDIFTSNFEYTNFSSNEPAGDIKSTVVTGKDYDIDSASSGEDNLGQILMSLISFKRLKVVWDDYKGGILLIDEMDASLFPRAQIELLKILIKQAKALDLQIIATTHSPTLISYALDRKAQCEKNENTKNDIEVNYLSTAHGKIACKSEYNFLNIVADLNLETLTPETMYRINCYTEDIEAYDMANKLMKNYQKKRIIFHKAVSLGAEQYLSLINRKIPEFSSNSIVILDGDVSGTGKFFNVVKLPTSMPPDQLIYDFLNNLDPSDVYWKNDHQFTKEVFKANEYSKIIRNNTKKDGNKYVLSLGSAGDKKCRDYFKQWYLNMKSAYFKKSKLDPFIRWREMNVDKVEEFREKFDHSYQYVFSNNKFMT